MGDVFPGQNCKFGAEDNDADPDNQADPTRNHCNEFNFPEQFAGSIFVICYTR